MSQSTPSKRVLVIQGHPSQASLSASLARAWVEGAHTRGLEIRWLRLGELTFDPVLHGSDPHKQTLEPDLVQAQRDLLWAEHMVWVFPVWWGGVPALVKGFLDRTLTSGFAYKFEGGSPMPVPLLKGRTAELLVPLDTPVWYYRFVQRMPALHQMRIATLGFCGIRTVRTQLFGPVVKSDPTKRADWLKLATTLGATV